jgi:hypothetical protein
VTGWLALERVDPFVTPEREDLRAATVAVAAHGAFGLESKLEDWVLRFGPPEALPDPTEAEKEAQAKALRGKLDAWVVRSAALEKPRGA